MLIQPPQPPLIIQTRAGNPIPNEQGMQLTDAEKFQRQAYQRGEFPAGQRLIVRKEPTGLYNCHGMTFLSRRAWLTDESAVDLILRDDGYYPITISQALAGDIILYYNRGELEHTGVVVDVLKERSIHIPWILSKWGHGGEYIHRYNYCPYYRDEKEIRWMRERQPDERSDA